VLAPPRMRVAPGTQDQASGYTARSPAPELELNSCAAGAAARQRPSEPTEDGGHRDPVKWFSGSGALVLDDAERRGGVCTDPAALPRHRRIGEGPLPDNRFNGNIGRMRPGRGGRSRTRRSPRRRNTSPLRPNWASRTDGAQPAPRLDDRPLTRAGSAPRRPRARTSRNRNAVGVSRPSGRFRTGFFTTAGGTAHAAAGQP